MSIHLTKPASDAIVQALAERGKGVGVRIEVRDAGQSCRAYRVEFADQMRESDLCFVLNGVRVFADIKHLAQLDGIQLDYLESGDEKGFSISHLAPCGSCECREAHAES